ncbi:hypothetical protein DPEC_G00367770 [Dallia pectoralis]|nr:hypothetical protein DPEC_G00367770 [Dallia pectoralis]
MAEIRSGTPRRSRHRGTKKRRPAKPRADPGVGGSSSQTVSLQEEERRVLAGSRQVKKAESDYSRRKAGVKKPMWRDETAKLKGGVAKQRQSC